MPSVRQFLLLGALWAFVAWVTTAIWGQQAQHFGFAESFTRYYALRAPFVGALAGMIWAPVLCAGMLPGHASTFARRPVGLAVERPTRWLFRGVQGLVVGQFVGATATVALLFLWPNDMQNDRFDAFKWGAVFWKLYWWMFVPCGGLAGVLSVTIARRTSRPRPPSPEP